MNKDILDIKDVLTYIHSTSWKGSRLGLTRMHTILKLLNDPQDKLKAIHVAGTNGKGSTCAMLSSILIQAGYKTGLYTSPYIQKFNERIQVDGVPISDDDLVSVTKRVRKYSETMEDCLTEFELITTIAFAYFAQTHCDVVILEVGLGGRLDATNVISCPEISVITSIDLDHTAELGNTIDKIAAEKAGIIKTNGHVVLYPQTPKVEAVVERACKEKKASLHNVDCDLINVKSSIISGHIFDYNGWYNLNLPLLGTYQLKNAATALTVVSLLQNRGWSITEEAIQEGLALTRWPARFEVIHKEPFVILDGGHNEQCVESIAYNLQHYFPEKKVTFIFGVLSDKNYNKMLDYILPLANQVITVAPDNLRALSAKHLKSSILLKEFENVRDYLRIEDAVKSIMNNSGKDDIVCVFGSFYMVGAVRTYFETMKTVG